MARTGITEMPRRRDGRYVKCLGLTVALLCVVPGNAGAQYFSDRWWMPWSARSETAIGTDIGELRAPAISGRPDEQIEALLTLGDLGGKTAASIIIEATKRNDDVQRRVMTQRTKFMDVEPQWLASIYALGTVQTESAKMTLLDLLAHYSAVSSAVSTEVLRSPLVPLADALSRYAGTHEVLSELLERLDQQESNATLRAFLFSRVLRSLVHTCCDGNAEQAIRVMLHRIGDGMVLPTDTPDAYYSKRLVNYRQKVFEDYLAFDGTFWAEDAPTRVLTDPSTPLEHRWSLCLVIARRLVYLCGEQPWLPSERAAFEAVVQEWLRWPKREKDGPHIAVSLALYESLRRLGPEATAGLIEVELRSLPYADEIFPGLTAK